jgi:hypothetical protein
MDTEARLRWQELVRANKEALVSGIAKVKSIDLQISKSLLLAERLLNTDTPIRLPFKREALILRAPACL